MGCHVIYRVEVSPGGGVAVKRQLAARHQPYFPKVHWISYPCLARRVRWIAAANGFPYLNRKSSFSSPTSIVSLGDKGRGSWPMDFPFRRAGVFPSTWVMK